MYWTLFEFSRADEQRKSWFKCSHFGLNLGVWVWFRWNYFLEGKIKLWVSVFSDLGPTWCLLLAQCTIEPDGVFWQLSFCPWQAFFSVFTFDIYTSGAQIVFKDKMFENWLLMIHSLILVKIHINILKFIKDKMFENWLSN